MPRAPRKPLLNREAAMTARPEKLEIVRMTERPDGGVEVTVNVPKTGFLRMIGGSGTVERTFSLDPMGREVYEACDGQSTVQAIAKNFAKKYMVGRSEAEVAVTTYLKTLMTKTLVGMEIDKKSVR
jgi:hypothetical protein